MGLFDWLRGKRVKSQAVARQDSMSLSNAPPTAQEHGQEDFGSQGLMRASQGDLDGAISDFSRAISLHPMFAPYFTNRGLARAMNGDLDGAIADYNQAIKLDPREALAYYNRGNAKWDKGDSEEAIADYDAALRIIPNHANAYYKRGYAMRKRGELDKAIADLNKAIKLNPQDASAHVQRAFARQAKGEFDGAAADFARAKALYGHPSEVVYYDDEPEPRQPPPLPDPPTGYSWVRAAQARAFFLRPHGWHFRSVEQPPVLDYLITKEPMPPVGKDEVRELMDLAIRSMEQGQYLIRRDGGLDLQGLFETGISISVWGYISQVKDMCPSEYARAYIEHRCQSRELRVEDTWSPQLDPFVSLGVQFRHKRDPDPLREYRLLVADDANDIVYHILFESPLRLWQKEWPIAKIVLERLVFHTEI